MNRFIAISVSCATALALWLAQPAAAMAGKDGQQYTKMDINKPVQAYFESGRLQWMKGGVDITMRSADPAAVPMRIRAEEAHFEYSDDSSKPSVINLQSNVHVDNADGTIRSNSAQMDVAGRKLTFTGSVRGALRDIGDFTADSIEYDMATGGVLILGLTGRDLDFLDSSKAAAPADPSLLTEADIVDAVGLINTFKAQAASEGPSPGKHILNLFELKLRRALIETPADQIPVGTLVEQLNNALNRVEFYDKNAWEGIALNEETTQLLATGPAELAEPDRTKLNRALLVAAYPGLVK